MATDVPEDFRKKFARSISETYDRSGAARWLLPDSAFAQALEESVRSWTASLSSPPADREVDGYLATLHAEDFALACACRIGLVSAWEYFVGHYRSILYDAARSITHDESSSRELADSLYADLYGLEERAGTRRPLLTYFHGRSSLRTWLRAVLAQRFVDGVRAAQRIEPLAEESERAAELVDPDPDRARYIESFAQALTSALSQLKPRDRMRLNFYYVEERNLKEIGRIMDEHESSASRRLSRTRKQLRRHVERSLRRDQHLNDEQIRLCYAYAMESWTVDLNRLLSDSL
jgi:RNA polymerase sigma-70 factor